MDERIYMDSKSLKYAIGLSITIVLTAMMFAIFSDKHLSADGANYFTILLSDQDFTYKDWTRQFANYASQLFLLIMLKFGSYDIGDLSTIFGLSILVPWIVAVSASLYALRDYNKSIFLFMLISIVSVNLSSDFILAGEHQVMVLFCWPILFFLLRKPPLTWFDCSILWSLSIMFLRLYPSALFPAVIFFILGIYRVLRADNLQQRIIFWGSVLLSGVSASIALYAILFPLRAGNKSSFSSAIWRTMSTSEILAVVVFVLFFFLGWRLKKNLLLFASLAPLVLLGIYTIVFEYTSSSHVSFSNRSLSITLLPVLMILAVYAAHKGLVANSAVSFVFTVFVVSMVLFSVKTTFGWRDFRSEMQLTLKNNQGVIPWTDTKLGTSPYSWRWNNTQLSVIWSNGCVRSVVENKKSSRWEPKAPPEEFPLRDYTCYSADFLQFDRSLCPCD